jgi:predicted MFS family arabinose efflux permease
MVAGDERPHGYRVADGNRFPAGVRAPTHCGGTAAMTVASDTEDRGERLLGGYSGRLLAVGVLGSMTVSGGQALISPLLPTIIDALAVSRSEAGLALTLMAALAGLGRYPGGRYSDSLTRKTVMVGALGLMVPGYLALGVASSYPVFLLGAALVGTGAGLYTPAVAGLLSDLFVDRRGQVFGINSASISVGGVLASGLATLVLATATWNAAFPPVVGVLVGLVVLLHVWSDEEYDLDRPSLSLVATVRRLLARPDLRKTVVALVLLSIVWRGTTGFLPTFLQAEKPLGPELANGAYGGLFVVGMVASPVAGRIGDRWGHAVVAAGTAGVGLVGLVALLLANSPVVVVGAVLVFALGLTAFWPVMNTYVMDVAPDSNMAGDFGAIGTVYIGLGSVGPTYVGVVADQLSYTAAFAGLSCCMLATVYLMVRLSRAD